ncbi:MAG TPA: hypothetical protein VM735_03830 [Candidatus Kapabacteria bacterium]|nr:hypothetical protein [Candidatus Kapabacteria bacterium]
MINGDAAVSEEAFRLPVTKAQLFTDLKRESSVGRCASGGASVVTGLKYDG